MPNVKPDVTPTAEAIDAAAEELERTAIQLRRIASSMRDDGDLSRTGEAMSAMQNLLIAARIDLFVTRPIRAIQYAAAQERAQ